MTSQYDAGPTPHRGEWARTPQATAQGLLVVSEKRRDLVPAQTVRISGTLRPWDVRDIGTYLNDNVNLELYSGLEDEELIFVAEHIERVDGAE